MVKEIEAKLRELAHPEIAAHSKRFFKCGKGEYGEGDKFLGIRVPVLRKLVKQYRHVSLDQAASLLRSEYHEQRLLALLLMVHIFSKADETGKKAVYDCYVNSTRYINNWDLVDSSAMQIVGAYLEHKDKSPLYRLVSSKLLWERRIAIIATFHFIKKGVFTDTLALSECLLQDEHDLIHKAVGWMLRELGKRDLDTERAFLDKHYSVMPRTMLRYAIERFPEDIRKQYLQGKITVA